MSKLPQEKKFLDLSDYGRPVASWIANRLKDTTITPVQVTLLFVVSGFLAIISILYQQYWWALFFLVWKSILDAADGELARVKNTPSYTGRYLDSVADIILNLLFLLTIWYVTNGSLWLMVLAFVGVQLQGTLYNYYYVILRNEFDGDTTSRVFENKTPVAFPGEKQSHVNVLFYMYDFCYKYFDKAIYLLDKDAAKSPYLPSWFMTMVSVFGLGFQLLIIGVMLVLGWIEFIIPFFIIYSLGIVLFVGMRKAITR